MAYQRVTAEERTQIYCWHQEGRGTREIARRLERAASSICREFVRNMGMRGYRPKQAHEKAQAQAKRPGPRRFTDQVEADAEARHKEARRSLTLDNGKEFARHEEIAMNTHMDVFFDRL